MALNYDPSVFDPTGGPDSKWKKRAGGPNAVVFFDDFVDGLGFTANNPAIASSQGKFSELANMGEWLVTVIDGGTDSGEIIICSDDAPGGVLTVTSNDADDDSVEAQVNGEIWALASGRDIVFECRLSVGDVDASDWMVGLSITDTTSLAVTSDFIGFGNSANTADVYCGNGKDAAVIPFGGGAATTRTDTGTDLSDGTVSTNFVTLRFEVTGTSEIRYFVDGVEVATHTTNLPDNEAMTATIGVRAAAAAAKSIYVDYVYVAATR